jgi:hypothetical protein
MTRDQREALAEQPAPPLLVKAGLAVGELPEVLAQQEPIGETAGPDTLGGAAGHHLLGAPRTNAEQEFQCGAIDPRTGQRLQLRDDVIDSGVPSGFGGHFCTPAYRNDSCATPQFLNL